MERVVVIANPAASQFTGGVHRAAQRILRRRYDLTVVWPNGADHARQVAADAVADGVEMVVAVGGDGIVHHVAQALVGSQTTLGIVPVGTTNVVARLFKIPKRPTAALRLLGANHLVLPIPVLTMTAATNTGEIIRHALFSAGMGVDAEVVVVAEAEPYRKYRFGSLHYLRKALSTVWTDLRHRGPQVTVIAGNERVNGIGFLAQIHPVYTYLGKRPLSIDSQIPDPLSVLVVEKLPFRRIGSIITAAARGRLADIEGFRLLHSPVITVETLERPLSAQLDGEIIQDIERARFSVAVEALRLAVPHPSKPPR